MELKESQVPATSDNLVIIINKRQGYTYAVYNYSRLVKLNCRSFGRGNVQRYRGRMSISLMWRPQMYLATRAIKQSAHLIDVSGSYFSKEYRLHNDFMKVWVSSLSDLCRELIVESPQSCPFPPLPSCRCSAWSSLSPPSTIRPKYWNWCIVETVGQPIAEEDLLAYDK